MNRFYPHLLFCSIWLSAVTSVMGQNTTPPASTSQSSSAEQTIIQLERDLIQAFNTGDAKVLERVLADDFEVDARQMKPMLLMYKKPYDADKIEASDLKARVWGNAAVVTGLMDIMSKKEDGTVNHQYERYTDTFINRQNKWQIVASQQREIPVWEARQLEDKELTALSSMECGLESSLRSLDSDTPAFIKFTNATNQPIMCYWINREGKRDSHPSQIRTIGPKKSLDLQTYLTHPFVITDASGKCLGIYTAKKEPGLVVIK